MKKIRNINGRLVCRINETKKLVEIKNKNITTYISFMNDKAEIYHRETTK